jgi:hypothetical protein
MKHFTAVKTAVKRTDSAHEKAALSGGFLVVIVVVEPGGIEPPTS